MSEQCDLVASVDETANKHIYDPLNSAVVVRRHRKLRVGC
jgi:hypothetical protein